MDPFVASPHWHGLIIAYFFLGGIAAGAYAVHTLAGLFGDEDVERGTRVAAYLAFPLVGICGVLLIADLERPDRFWHMLIKSETLRPMFKWWSPMSAGSWGLMAFSGFSFASFLGVLAEDNRFGLGRWSGVASRLRRGAFGHLFEAGGTLSALFLGAYTGTLLSASNQPVWSQSTWLSALFLVSAASTGTAAVVLLALWLARDLPGHVIGRLEWLDGWAMAAELVTLAAFSWSLGPAASRAFSTWPGVLVPAFVVPAGLVLPLAARLIPGRASAVASASLALAGGLALRYAVVTMPEAFVVGA